MDEAREVIINGETITLRPGEVITEATLDELTGGKGDD